MTDHDFDFTPAPPITRQTIARASHGVTRRDFGKLVATLSALGCIEPQYAARALGKTPNRLSWMAYRTAGAEGFWNLTDVEGEVPPDLHGTLYRIAPGQSENHGVTLQHFFDGDAFVSGFSIRDGKVALRSRFVETPQRMQEQEAGKMLFAEFGTLPPGERAEDGRPVSRVQFKNQPNVNVIHYDGQLLGLSEGGPPTAIDPATLAYKGEWDFHGTLPQFQPFTAHPKYDPETGEAFAYGVSQGPGMALTVFRMEPDGKLSKLHAVPQKGYFMIHDMLITRNSLVFVIPPVRFDLARLLSGKAAVADAIQFYAEEPTRFVVLDRKGGGEPKVFEQPGNMVFHNGNAFEKDGKIVVDTILSSDDGPLRLLKAHAQETLPEVSGPRLTRIVLDLKSGQVVSRTEFGEEQEFPRFDIRSSGDDARYLYTMEGGIDADPLVSNRLVRNDLHKGDVKRVEAAQGQALGETVFVPKESSQGEHEGWLLLQGYDSGRDENFLEIRDADTFDLAARVWTGQHFPLGFHGNFVPNVFVDPT
jgi:carotenoid cleavage dioxygenase-like enzyme